MLGMLVELNEMFRQGAEPWPQHWKRFEAVSTPFVLWVVLTIKGGWKAALVAQR